MPTENVGSEVQNESGDKRELENYKLELGTREAMFLTQFLPPGYSLQI